MYLYDFNLIAGDTLTIQEEDNFRGFLSDGDTNVLFQVVVDSIMIKSFRSNELLHLYTSPTVNSAFQFGLIIEKVGSITNLFGENTTIPAAGYIGSFRCYEDNEIDITFENCELISSLFKLKILSTFNVYPNPAKNEHKHFYDRYARAKKFHHSKPSG